MIAVIYACVYWAERINNQWELWIFVYRIRSVGTMNLSNPFVGKCIKFTILFKMHFEYMSAKRINGLSGMSCIIRARQCPNNIASYCVCIDWQKLIQWRNSLTICWAHGPTNRTIPYSIYINFIILSFSIEYYIGDNIKHNKTRRDIFINIYYFAGISSESLSTNVSKHSILYANVLSSNYLCDIWISAEYFSVWCLVYLFNFHNFMVFSRAIFGIDVVWNMVDHIAIKQWKANDNDKSAKTFASIFNCRRIIALTISMKYSFMHFYLRSSKENVRKKALWFPRIHRCLMYI